MGDAVGCKEPGRERRTELARRLCSTFPRGQGRRLSMEARGCAEPTGLERQPLISGGIVVTDAQVLPVKAQCLNGGWRTFGVFRNQGDCVSFVASKGKKARVGGG